MTIYWEQCELATIATVKARIGWQGLTKKEYLDDGDYYLITGTDFSNGTIDFENCHYVSELRYNQDQNIQINDNDVLVTKDGTLGKVAFIHKMNKKGTLNSGVFVIRGNQEKINQGYLFHYLDAPYLLDFANEQATGGTIKHLNQNILVKFPVPFPNILEQMKISELLFNINTLITLHQREYRRRYK